MDLFISAAARSILLFALEVLTLSVTSALIPTILPYTLFIDYINNHLYVHLKGALLPIDPQQASRPQVAVCSAAPLLDNSPQKIHS